MKQDLFGSFGVFLAFPFIYLTQLKRTKNRMKTIR